MSCGTGVRETLVLTDRAVREATGRVAVLFMTGLQDLVVVVDELGWPPDGKLGADVVRRRHIIG
jgi:hypothetical protein